MTGLMLLARLAQTGRSLEDLAAVTTRLPQVLINVRGVDTGRVDRDEAVQSAVRAAQAELDGIWSRL
jgi:phosphoglucosamine mutase